MSNVEKQQAGQQSELKPGFTWRSILGILFASLVMLPISMYLSLASGASISLLIVPILFSELGRLLNARMSKQEIFIIFQMAFFGAAVFTPMAFLGSNIGSGRNVLSFVYRSYFVTAVPVQSFTDAYTGSPLQEVVPRWWAPPLSSHVHEARILLDAAWAIPFLVFFALTIFHFGQEISLTMITSQLYIEVEKLPFPYASIDAQMCTALAERPPERMRYFSIAATIGLAYGFILYFLPITANWTIIPIPWVDLTTGTIGIEGLMPGAILGIATDAIFYTQGFMLPFNIVLFMLIGSLSVWTFGNWIALQYFPDVFPLWKEEWMPGLTLNLIYQRSYFRVWLGPLISFALALTTLIMIRERSSIISSFRALSRLSVVSKQAGYLQLRYNLLLYFGASAASLIVFHYFVPGFPLWLAALISIGFSFVNALVATRGIGEAGNPVSVPYVWQGTILFSGYKGMEPWFISPAVGGWSAGWWANAVKGCYLTETRPASFFKALLVSTVVVTIMSFFYASFFWSIAPIPSSIYPMSLVTWPLAAITQALWSTGQILAFSQELLITSYLGMLAILTVGELIQKYTPIPFSAVGLLVGATILPTLAIPYFIGSVIGWQIIRRLFGEKEWNENRAIMAGGVAAGEAVITGIAAVTMLIARGTWILPW